MADKPRVRVKNGKAFTSQDEADAKRKADREANDKKAKQRGREQDWRNEKNASHTKKYNNAKNRLVRERLTPTLKKVAEKKAREESSGKRRGPGARTKPHLNASSDPKKQRSYSSPKAGKAGGSSRTRTGTRKPPPGASGGGTRKKPGARVKNTTANRMAVQRQANTKSQKAKADAWKKESASRKTAGQAKAKQAQVGKLTQTLKAHAQNKSAKQAQVGKLAQTLKAHAKNKSAKEAANLKNRIAANKLIAETGKTGVKAAARSAATRFLGPVGAAAGVAGYAYGRAKDSPVRKTPGRADAYSREGRARVKEYMNKRNGTPSSSSGKTNPPGGHYKDVADKVISTAKARVRGPLPGLGGPGYKPPKKPKEDKPAKKPIRHRIDKAELAIGRAKELTARGMANSAKRKAALAARKPAAKPTRPGNIVRHSSLKLTDKQRKTLSKINKRNARRNK